jgi:hypothetical protein
LGGTGKAIAFIGSDPGITGKFYRRDRPLLGGTGKAAAFTGGTVPTRAGIKNRVAN